MPIDTDKITAKQNINVNHFTKDEIRRAVQLAIIKGMQKTTQHQHAITPEAIALFIGYLAKKLIKDQEIRIFDPVSGTGNLLLTVLNYLEQTDHAYASEIDTTLLKIALNYANLLETEVEFFHQDSLRPFLLDPVDLIIADLPVGYYPDDVQAAEFELNASEGHAYAHFLLIEQSVNYTKEGGFLILLVPENLFTSDLSTSLHSYLQKHVHILGLIQLNESTFKSKEHKKSIFILQKKGEQTKEIKQPLMAMLPSFKNTAGMEDITQQINQWFKDTAIQS